MRVLIRVVAIVLGTIVLVVCAGLFWIFAYSGDLPDMKALAQFAPSQATHVSDPCLREVSVAIPYESIGDHLVAAIRAAEGEDDSGVLTHEFRGATPGRANLSMQIARSMFCTPSKTLNREVMELRTSVQLERRFSRRELFTIYANRAWFGDGQVGVEAASQHFFHKEPDQLQIEQAALLAGLISRPSYFSPLTHPDRALKRRNDVIDAMVEARAITAEEAETAKKADLGIATN